MLECRHATTARPACSCMHCRLRSLASHCCCPDVPSPQAGDVPRYDRSASVQLHSKRKLAAAAEGLLAADEAEGVGKPVKRQRGTNRCRGGGWGGQGSGGRDDVRSGGGASQSSGGMGAADRCRGRAALHGHRMPPLLRVPCLYPLFASLFLPCRCFNCGSYGHSVRECWKEQDRAAVEEARRWVRAGRRAGWRLGEGTCAGAFPSPSPSWLHDRLLRPSLPGTPPFWQGAE